MMRSVSHLPEIDGKPYSSFSKKTRNRICIITSAPVCCNPRVLKEADVLSGSGFDVRVIASEHVLWTVRWDIELMEPRKWTLQSVRWDSDDPKARRTRLYSGLRQRVFQLLAGGITYDRGLAERAYCRMYSEQLRLAVAQKADLYIAHNPQALPVAAAAAQQHGTRFAFDSEDYHCGEFVGDSKDLPPFRLLSYLERKYLRECAYVSSPSDQISRVLAKRYGIRMPLTVHNCFALADRFKLDGKTYDRRGNPLSLYWYSQRIGLDRGIQDVIRAASIINRPIQIHLRGDVSHSVQNELLTLAREHSVADMIFFHPIVRPTELLSRAVEHDVGLALESNLTENKSLTVSNKLFTYLLAGLAIAASGTVGQRFILENVPGAGFVYPCGDYSSLAVKLRSLADAPELLRQHKETALAAAKNRWNWELESTHLVEYIASEIFRTKRVRSA